MSSVMRCRRDVMESSFAKGMCCKQPLHAFAREFSEKGGGRIRQRGLFALKCWCHANTAQRFSPKSPLPKVSDQCTREMVACPATGTAAGELLPSGFQRAAC